MTAVSSIKRLGFFTRLLDQTSAVERYRLASEAFSVALETAVADDDATRVAQGAAVLDRRRAYETEIMSGWSPVGR